MTQSEQICNEIGAKFFCKDFAYENLSYFNTDNKKVELCDALFEYASIYVPLQIKERSKNKGTKSEESWLIEIVYGEAFKQIETTVFAIKNNNITVNDLYHQKVNIDKNYLIFPMIVFDNPLVKDYRRVLFSGDLKINVFNLEDYKAMMGVIKHPYDIVYYLQERAKLINSGKLPDVVVGDGDRNTIFATIKTEYDFAAFFIGYIYDGQPDKQQEALRHLALISTFRDRQIKKNPNYKQILKILQNIEPKNASAFMERFDYAWKCACEDRFDFSKSLMVKIKDKKIAIVFFSIGRKELSSPENYSILFDAKQLRHKTDAVLIISFVGDRNNHCKNDWVYFEKEYIEEDYASQYYDKIGMYNGTMTYDLYESICQNMLNKNNNC